MDLFKLEKVSFQYPNSQKETLTDVSFSVQNGDFTVLCGATGSGKSTLLRLLKHELTPRGLVKGNIFFEEKRINEIPLRESASKIGFVMQAAEQQIVTDKVYSELAFGLENLGINPLEIRRRVAETAAYFGIDKWFDNSVNTLSGGQKQLLNLASVMVMQPKILILDEPTAQLDPIAAESFLNTVKKLNQNLGISILLSEHRTEEILPMATKVIVLQQGHLFYSGSTLDAVRRMESEPLYIKTLPGAVQLHAHLSDFQNISIDEKKCPLSICEGRKLLMDSCENQIRRLTPPAKESHSKKETARAYAVELQNVYFGYEKKEKQVIHDLTFKVNTQETYCILGGNGAGKTTALKLLGGLLDSTSGKIKLFDKKIKEYKGQELYRGIVSMLPQDVQTVFLKNTVKEELRDAGLQPEDLPIDLSYCMERHPYDLSGGEQQIVGILKAIANKPQLLLLDEPTKGLDANSKSIIGKMLSKLRDNGMTILLVSHDVEFAAEYADHCALFFDGQIVSEGKPQEFFGKNNYYTTVASKLSRDYYDDVATMADLYQLCDSNKESI